MPVSWLSEKTIDFPPVEFATEEGVLAAGGDLSPERLLNAYRQGIFPWFNPGEPILWWSPDPRFVLFPADLRVSKSMRPYFNQHKFSTTFDQDFRSVMLGCQQRRSHGWGGTWITDEMVEAYCQLHEQGHAHSVEVWEGNNMVGGLYGLSLGKCFFGESMFSLMSNASKFGFITLVQKLQEQGFQLIDCQQQTRHLASLGAGAIPRQQFLEMLQENEKAESLIGNWGEIFASKPH